MQTKSSYRVLNWTLLAALATSLATACVVSSGDGNDNGTDITDGGSSGKTSTSKGGSAGTGGSSSKGGSSGSTSTAGTESSTDGGQPPVGGSGAGGGGSEYVAGLCQADNPTPMTLPVCDLQEGEADSTDPDVKCSVCLRTQCCTDWKQCYGSEPTTACGYGATSKEDLGQFDCIRQCVVANGADATDNTANFEMCADQCLNQCADVDGGLPLDDTNALLGCANDNCIADCFPVE